MRFGDSVSGQVKFFLYVAVVCVVDDESGLVASFSCLDCYIILLLGVSFLCFLSLFREVFYISIPVFFLLLCWRRDNDLDCRLRRGRCFFIRECFFFMLRLSLASIFSRSVFSLASCGFCLVLPWGCCFLPSGIFFCFSSVSVFFSPYWILYL